MTNNRSEFYQLFGCSKTNSQVEGKSDIDLEQEIPLCNICSYVILKPYKQNHKLFCSSCGKFYDPHYELIQVQDQETTLDELSSQGVITTKQDDIKPRVTLNREKGNKHENLEYVKKEFEKYHEIEIIDNTNKNLKNNRYG
jgi:DNA-directed RNA polymerase subunit M/transcription elongation factor TFIIS